MEDTCSPRLTSTVTENPYGSHHSETHESLMHPKCWKLGEAVEWILCAPKWFSAALIYKVSFVACYKWKLVWMEKLWCDRWHSCHHFCSTLCQQKAPRSQPGGGRALLYELLVILFWRNVRIKDCHPPTRFQHKGGLILLYMLTSLNCCFSELKKVNSSNYRSYVRITCSFIHLSIDSFVCLIHHLLIHSASNE